MGKLINGTALAQEIQAEVGEKVRHLAGEGVRPGLAVILAGGNPASQVYVRSKVRTCEALGMRSERIDMPSDSATEEVLSIVRDLNQRPDIHGILVQLPLPRHIDGKHGKGCGTAVRTCFVAFCGTD